MLPLRTTTQLLACALLLMSPAAPGAAQATEAAATRDPWLWPFAATSIWNQPLGNSAVYRPAHLSAAAHVGVDIQHLLRLNPQDPDRHVLGSTTFGQGRAAGTVDLGFTLNVPDAWVVPDAGPGNPYGLTPNSNFALLMPDGEQVMQGCQITRAAASGPVHVPEWLRWSANRPLVSIRGDGLEGGGQGASHMSSLGGTIRLHELVGDAPIRHALKINPFAARWCHYSAAVPGWRWPARGADSYAATGYHGQDPALVMGSLLAIPPQDSAAKLGLVTAPGRKLFAALQDYGMYVVEDAAWDTWDLIVERGAEQEFATAYGFSMDSPAWRDEVNRLMVALAIVDNNGPGHIGGGGTPRRPLAPPFAVLR